MGVAGVGYFGKFHAAKIAATADAKLVAVADIELSVAREVARAHGAASFADVRDMLGKVEAVSVAVPTRAASA